MGEGKTAERRNAIEMRRMFPHLYEKFNRDQWAKLRANMPLEISDEARRFIAQQGFDPIYGARPLRRFISRQVETRIGRALLAGDVLDGAVIRIGYADGELTVSYENQD